MAFIYDTLETTTTYFIVIVFVVGVYLVLWGIIRSITLCCLQCKRCSEEYGNNTIGKSDAKNEISIFYTIYLFAKRYLRIWSYAMFSCAMAFAAYYMLGLLLFIFTLVSFNDFEAAHNLVIAPVLVALVGIFVAKPFYLLIKKTFLDERNKSPAFTYV